MSEALRTLLLAKDTKDLPAPKTRAERLAQTMYENALNGTERVIAPMTSLLLDRTEGKVSQVVEVGGGLADTFANAAKEIARERGHR